MLDARKKTTSGSFSSIQHLASNIFFREEIMQTLFQDLRYGARMLLKNPGFTLIAVTTLALGIGANTAIFSVINTVLLRPLPYLDPERIVLVLHDNRIAKIERDFVSYQNFQDIQNQNKSFDRMAAATSVW